MSEPGSLFAKITIKENRFRDFLSSVPASPHRFSDWQHWWNTKQMHGDGLVTEEKLSRWHDNAAQKVEDLMHASYISEFDAETSTWRLGILEFSENYEEMIGLLAPLRGIADYKEQNADDFLLVFPFIWGEDYTYAYLVFEEGESRFVELPSIKHKEEATEWLTKKHKEYLSKFLLDSQNSEESGS